MLFRSNLKVGSFFRGIGSTITNRKEIDWLKNLLWSVPLVIGTVLGVMVIAHLHQRWMLPAIIAAIALSEFAPWLAKRVTKGSIQAASLATGAYAGYVTHLRHRRAIFAAMHSGVLSQRRGNVRP